MNAQKTLKRMTAPCLAAALALTCCACSAQQTAQTQTAAQVVEAMQTALAQTPCGQMQLAVDMAVTLDAGEYGTMDMDVAVDYEITVSQDPVSGYTVSTVEIDLGGETTQSVTENYSVVEDGGLVSYIHSSGVWMKLSTGQTPEELAASASSVGIDAASAALDETVTEWEGAPAICVTAQLSGDGLEDILGGTLDSLNQLGGALSDAAETASSLDYSALTCDVRLYLDPETYLPIAEEMTLDGMSDMFSALDSELGMSVNVTSCTAAGAFLSYDPQPEAVLPDGAKEQAETWTRLLSGDPDNGDGTYTIREGAVLTDVAAPEGFELDESDYDHVYFQRDDHRQVQYTMYYGSAEDLTAMVDQRVSHYESLGGTVSREQMTLPGDTLTFDCDIVSIDWSSLEQGLMYAWADLGSDGVANYYLLVEVDDGYNDGMGHEKSVDVTAEEFLSYLNAASLNALTA